MTLPILHKSTGPRGAKCGPFLAVESTTMVRRGGKRSERGHATEGWGQHPALSPKCNPDESTSQWNDPNRDRTFGVIATIVGLLWFQARKMPVFL